ncbi:molybdate ABC transporter substrate-binding protein [Neptuniibacter sp. CAU 1671]|uniref:molybdate ABC transporter substrate-binding protein n=1 Tax=Neptuniibacter sp. CAU 1671 TaxID=3032593 RepID=UPI0023DC9475|nr:molybdate ABC transporter substrate-binding protein [Neptuniibacter sp. CAU 1671]MDF2180611.1 molybdate ABC transporter substrate-binding protein [Neptuniibacter sp. CAU 1671]
MSLRPILTMLLLSIASASQAEQVYVAVAANFSAPMKQLAELFEQQTGHQVHISAGASGKLFAQIQQGAPFQLFFSADQTKPATLESLGLTVPDSRFTYAIGTLALWTPTPGLEMTAATLKTAEFNHLALANPKLAPYGSAAIVVLDQLNLVRQTQRKWVMGENISQTYQFVSTGNAEFGFVSLSQILFNGKVKEGSVWVVPQHMYPEIRQDAVLLKSAAQHPAANDFLAFIRSADGAGVIQQYGYITPE